MDRGLVARFRYGFSFHFKGKESQQNCKNSKEANLQATAVDAKIMEDLNNNKLAGPFSEPPLPNFNCSPLSVWAKSEPGKYRLLHNLSYPYDSSSVNGGIPQEYKTVKYATIQTAVHKINKLGRGCCMAKADVKSAYRIVPINPAFYHLLGFKWRGFYYYDKLLPMGLGECCSLF